MEEEPKEQFLYERVANWYLERAAEDQGISLSEVATRFYGNNTHRSQQTARAIIRAAERYLDRIRDDRGLPRYLFGHVNGVYKIITSPEEAKEMVQYRSKVTKTHLRNTAVKMVIAVDQNPELAPVVTEIGQEIMVRGIAADRMAQAVRTGDAQYIASAAIAFFEVLDPPAKPPRQSKKSKKELQDGEV